VARADALGRELEDVVQEFTGLTTKELPGLNQDLQARQLAPLRVISEADWRKTM
jgi:hypothetical protein